MPVDQTQVFSVEAPDHRGLWGLRPSETQTRDVPHELFLRGLQKLDTESIDDVSRFTADVGLLRIPDNGIRKALGHHSQRLVHLADQQATWDGQSDTRDGVIWMAEGELLLNATLTKTIAAHWIAAHDESDVVDVWRPLHAPAHRPTEQSVWSAWSNLVNELLAPISPMSVSVEGLTGRHATLAAPRIGLSNVVAGQIWRACDKHLDLRTCPHCGTRFQHHEGRSITGQYRETGVMYCSKSCAQAVAQKRYRARKRKERDG